MNSHDLVITTFNSYKYLESLYELINSNVAKYNKIIIVDDCSNLDFFVSLKSKIKKFKNTILLKNETNLGPSASRNIGIDFSKSTYISFHDPDDYVHKERFEIISYYIEKFQPQVLFHDYTTLKLKKHIVNNFKFKIHSGFFYLFKSLYVTPAFTCKRDLLNQVGGYKKDIKFAEDLDLYIRLRNKSKFLFVNQELVKITCKSDRINNSDHLSSNIKLMRISINKILISNIFPVNNKSIIFLLALVNNIFKTFVD